MAAMLVGCCGFLSTRISKKVRERKEREMEYSQNFEILKEENAKRVRQLSDAGVQGYENFRGGAALISERGVRGGSLESTGSSGRAPRPQMQTVRESEGRLGEGRLGQGNGVGLVRGLPSYEDVVSTNPRTACTRSGSR